MCSEDPKWFVQDVQELKVHLDISFIPSPPVSSLDPTIDTGFRIHAESSPLSRRIPKKRKNTTISMCLALELKHTMYPEPDRVHIQTDGALLKDSESADQGCIATFSFFFNKWKIHNRF
ncbi:hypothetical protein TNCV_4778381 [Trichonephila clavipes]|nr:hypothetical protein TNCV_4778381 [Trichonephila clavipes]